MNSQKFERLEMFAKVAKFCQIWSHWKQSATSVASLVPFQKLFAFCHTSAQSYKHFTLVNYDSRLVITSKLLIRTTLEL